MLKPNTPRTKQQLCVLLTPKQLTKSASSAMFLLYAKNHTSLGNLSKGKGTADDGHTLSCAYAIAQAFREIGLGADLADELDAAQAALCSLRLRAAWVGAYILQGPELAALTLGMEVCDAQLDVCTDEEWAEVAAVANMVDEVSK